ncbi:MAG: hypothetical protein KJ767_02730 [Nanoarchaeota archaeon]|nr:hypothetical protein [Nanoarchaeota archaeon]
MKLPKEFEYYIKKGIVRIVKADKQKAEFLINESDTTFRGLNKRLNSMGIDEDNVNSIIKDCYDILMELIRASLLLDGYSTSGNYAHEAEVSYLKKLKFNDNEISFLNDLRKNRNSITYYGKILNKEYAGRVIEFTKKNYLKLKKITEKIEKR